MTCLLHRIVRLALVLLLLAAPQAGATAEPLLRPEVEVDAAQVTLGDLFEHAGAVADQAVLPAPAPGASMRLSVADAFDLANSHGLGWRPLVPFEHVVITRAWRPLEQAEVMAALAAALRRVGAANQPGERLEIELPAKAVQIKVARGALAELSVENAVYDRAGGRFQATLVVRDSHRQPRRQTVNGRVLTLVELPVLRARLRTDQVIRPDDIVIRSFRADRAGDGALSDPAEMIGLSPMRSLTPGRPVHAGDLGAPTLVARGSLVTMQLIRANMRLLATGRAQESGALGDVIPVRNVHSRLIVEGVVTGPGQVATRPFTYDVTSR